MISIITVLPSPSSLPPPPTNPNLNPFHSSNPSSPPQPLRARLFRCPCRRTGPSWDPNAESVRSGRFRFRDDEDGAEYGDFQGNRKRKWWSDDLDEEFSSFEDDDDDDDAEFEQPWDRIWIFKVFKSYGYLLPAILASMLVATGPKAILMALALPLGQLALSLAFKVWGKTLGGSRRKPFASSSNNSSTGFRKQGRGGSSSECKGRKGYQPWVSEEDGVADKGGGSRGSGFGGWDELDRKRGPVVGGPPQTELAKKGKVSKRGRYRDVPLFFRLLVAVFPFLGSWSRIL